MNVVSSYLTKTTSAPMQKELVLIPDPYCDSVDIIVTELPRCRVDVDFDGVPVGKLEAITDK
jgi:Zn-dependent M16 (insulinase) family peptidase